MRVNFERKSRRREAACIHFGTSKEYKWSIPDGMDIQAGDVVWVDTHVGYEVAKVVEVIDSRGTAEREVIGRVTSMEVDEGIKC